MATNRTFASQVTCVIFLAAAAVQGCTPRPDGPAPSAERFFAALATGDTATAAQLSDDPGQAREALNAAWAGLQATHLDAQVLGSKYTEDTGTVTYRYTWHLPKNRTWTYDGQLKMARYEGRWQVRWTTTGLHPRLGEHQTFALRADPPQRASVHELGGTDVLAPGTLYHYTLDASRAGSNLIATVHAVVDALRPFDDTLDPQLLAERASSSTKPVELITLRTDDNNRVAPMIGSLPGVVITPQAELLPTDDRFAPAVVNQVKKAVIDRIDGEAGWRVVSVNQNGVDVAVLQEVEPSPAPSVSISLDRAVQNAAQHAVDGQGGKAMLVVIKPSTGEILAIAQNA
ncbi:MAG: penicillin-binding transpeptidase domain-containing protein, partial [Mycobacterium sp.]|nr:penicillin-binding transpeptidase domain-containing protein [Mycobacterium sp.]